MRPEDTHPAELTRMRILHKTQEYLEQDDDWHNSQANDHGCEHHPNSGPGCWHNATQAELRELGKALALSPTLDVCEALLRGETVPISKLDPSGLRKLGRP